MESSVLTPGGVEHGGGDGETPVAGNADEVGVAMLAWKRSVKGVVRIKLYEAYLAAMKAFWAQPMRGVAVCRRLLEHIGRKAGGKRLQLVAVRVRLELLQLEKFCFKRIAFINGALMLVDEAKFRRLMFDQFLLDVKQGHVGVGAVRHVHGCLDALKDGLERLLRIRGAFKEFDWCWHTGHYTIIVPCTGGGTL